MNTKVIEYIEQYPNIVDAECYGVYPASIHRSGEYVAFMVNVGAEDKLVAMAELGFIGESVSVAGRTWTEAAHTHENAVILREKFPFTAPSAVLGRERTIGLGDRLGIATPGHIRALQNYDICPVFAQQSIRELNLTGRNYEDVLDSASFAVFREGYTGGFGADGDHLKTAEEVRYAISCGYTMITLDCSEYIRNDVAAMSDEEVLAEYQADPALEERYIGKKFTVGATQISFDAMEFYRICLIYNRAIDFAAAIFDQFFAGRKDALNFEVSIDETMTPTTPAQHFYVANELKLRNVRPDSVAPRFCGEFQKGIDYIGDLAQFEKEFAIHTEIAAHFNYKISVHSGSDKFSVFRTVGKCTQGKFHVKTAGTNWLEAMAVVAEHEPVLYREIHEYALEYAFENARKYYHVTTNIERIPKLDTLSDQQLPSLFQDNDARQLIHITYGLILSEKLADGTYRFRDRLYKVWRTYAEEYAKRLETHIGKHLSLLYSGFLAKEN